MDFSAVGQKIKELRKEMGISQGELAEGICTQAQISKIEKGDVYPYASTLYLISQKLGVDVNYFFDIGMTPRLDYVQEVFQQLKLARLSMNYNEIRQIVKAEENNPLFTQNSRNYQILLWHKGICEYEMNKDYKEAIKYIEQAISSTQTTEKRYSEREIECLVSIAVIYFEEKMYDKALEINKDALKYLNNLPYVSDNNLKSHLNYNIARILTRMGRYDESIEYCKKGIKWCVQHNLLFALPEFHYHLGYNHELKNEFQEAKNYMDKAYNIFEVTKETRFCTFIREKYAKWRNENKLPS
ncbi:tetratricopeptide repeat protein [Peribacillus sp. SCS-155]|uniref:tetratricopeptide repeat protein n=1 Tax=Peribacillus sedimenti TaxID=3115297 RepID=UPI0039059C38